MKGSSMRHYQYGDRKAWLRPRSYETLEVAFNQANALVDYDAKGSLILYVFEDDELILAFDLQCSFLRTNENWFYMWREAILKKSRAVIKEHDENLLIRA